jgi:glycerophosphoryl diester phosphodiesterase
MAIVIGHRGARALAPENTLKGINVAKNHGADLVEVDVRLSADGMLVLMHDESVDRTTNGSGKVEDLTFSELRSLDAGGERVPTLKEATVLSRKLGLGIVVEMKEEGLEEMVANEVKNTDAIVTSFYHTSLVEIKELIDVRTGVIISSLPARPVELALWTDADAILPKRINPKLFKEAHREGIKVYPWTINTEEEASWMMMLGADGLVTDNPSLIRNIANLPIRRTGKDNCEYYPCHFEGQVCIHCYCPLYPCKDPLLGSFITTKRRGKRVWSCINCVLVHNAVVAKYLRDHPDATTEELRAVDSGEIDAS